LVGLRGAGKSTVAGELARALGLPVADLDARIVERARKPIPRIFAEDGEERFRELESDELEVALAAGGVLAPGGGIVTRDRNRDALRRSGAFVVYLAARPETLAARVAADVANVRPALVAGGPLAEARALLAAREPRYRELAHLTVETDELSPVAVSERIRAALESSPP
jgi:shikimate kinase